MSDEPGPMRPPAVETVCSSPEPLSGREPTMLVASGRKIAEWVGDDALVGLKTAGGVITPAWGARLSSLGEEDLVQIVDVDPVKSLLLFSGPGDPDPWAAVIALVMRYREDLTAAAWIPAPETSSAAGRPRRVGTEAKGPTGTGAKENQGWGFKEEEEEEPSKQPPAASHGNIVEWSGEALRALRKGSDVVMPGGHRLVVGSNLEAVEGVLRRSARK